MKFSEWLKLKEDGATVGATTTVAIAGYNRPIFSCLRRRSSLSDTKKKLSEDI